jgi:uncharacterized delta-60 repeat protein
MRRTAVIAAIVLTIGSASAAAATPGELDPTFSGDGIATAFAAGSVANGVAVDHAGRTVVVGETVDGHVDVAVARFRPDGTPDPSFDGNGRVRMSLGADAAAAFDVAIATDDGLAIVGRRTVSGAEDSFVLRLGPDGQPVAAFGVDGLATVDFGKQESANAVSFTAKGRIDIGGYVSNGTSVRCAFARLESDGSPDDAFSGDGMRFLDLSPGAEQVNDLVVLPAGNIVAAGYAESGTQPRFVMLRLHGNGDLATGFGDDGVTRTDLGPGADIANAIVLTGSGGFVLAGSAGNSGHRDWGVARYLGNGSPDASFGDGGAEILRWSAAAEAADDVAMAGKKIVLAGRIHDKGTGDDAGIVRLRAGGRLDGTFATSGVERIDVSGGTDAAHGLAQQANGKIVLAGETWSAGAPRFLVARLTAG